MGAIRLTGGRARGRVLREPVPSGVRPTGSRVREALFSMLGHNQHGVRWLDAFGGAGVVGLEAWSRGAVVTVVEKNRAAVEGIRRRGDEVGADWRVVAGDVLQLAPSLGAHDVVFADPPYALPILPILETLAPCAARWLVAEVRGGPQAPARVAHLHLERARSYGSSALWLYRADPPEGESA